MQPNPQGMASKGFRSPASAGSPARKATAFSSALPASGPSVPHPSHVGGKCEPPHTRIGKSSVRSESEAAIAIRNLAWRLVRS
jgi:hypothetical protein